MSQSNLGLKISVKLLFAIVERHKLILDIYQGSVWEKNFNYLHEAQVTSLCCRNMWWHRDSGSFFNIGQLFRELVLLDSPMGNCKESTFSTLFANLT